MQRTKQLCIMCSLSTAKQSCTVRSIVNVNDQEQMVDCTSFASSKFTLCHGVNVSFNYVHVPYFNITAYVCNEKINKIRQCK